MTKTVTVNDDRQHGYTYQVSEPIGKNFAPEFQPQLTPQQMLELGVFDGYYLNHCQDEFPKSWFTHAKLAPNDTRDEKLNYFHVHASQPLSVWQKKGWIHPDDPRGWFQWYCRYYMGRRHDDDERQMKRWKAMKRHIAQIQKNCHLFDEHCRPVQRQALLHWAYDSRKI